MFGVGPSELVIVFLLVLLLFGPSKLPQMARDVGRFVGEARRSIDEFKDELTSSVDDEGSQRNSRRNSYQQNKNSPAKKKETPADDGVGENSREKEYEKQEEYDF